MCTSNTPLDLFFEYAEIKHIMEVHKQSTAKPSNFNTSLKSVL